MQKDWKRAYVNTSSNLVLKVSYLIT